MTEKMIVDRIEVEEDRVLFYDSNPGWLGYHIIAEPEEAAEIKVGDEIIYEPYGINFGWFVEKVS